MPRTRSVDPEPASDDLDARVMDMVHIMAKIAARDFSEKPALVEGDDALSHFTVGFRFMIEDLERALTELEQEKSKLTEANEQLLSLDRAKTRFINTAAHELGTPLTPIMLQLDLLRQGMQGPLTPKQAISLDMLDRNLTRLATLVHEMLDVARLQADRMRLEIEVCDVGLLAKQAVESFAEQARIRGIDLRVDADSQPLAADANRISQVLFNLVTNALKFTPAGGHVLVRVESTGDGVLVSVIDDGIGLEPAEIAKLFQPFSQASEPLHQARGGTGLGLYISKGIIELHQGQIGCSSKGRNQGSEFHFSLPAHVPPRPSAPVGF